MGAVTLILGAIVLALVYPAFGEAWTTMRHTNSTRDIPTWTPPELRAVLEHEIEMVHSEFYEQAILMGLGLLLLLCGIYLCLGSRRKLHELPKKG
jgi:hypothetical protein